MNDLREKLAALSHSQWSGWMKYLFSRGQTTGNGDLFVLPKYWWTRWLRQTDTPYADLSESEKESDRKEADRVLDLIQPIVDALRESYSELWETYGDTPRLRPLFDKIDAALPEIRAIQETTDAAANCSDT